MAEIFQLSGSEKSHTSLHVMNATNQQTANSVSIRRCEYTGATIIQPLRGGNLMMRQAGVAIYRKTQLAQAFESIRRECVLPESLETEIRGHADFQRLPM